MEKYKEIYNFQFERDSEGKADNYSDNYLSCRKKAKIYRIDDDVLKFISNHRIKIKNVDKVTGKILWDYTDLLLDVWDSDVERIITFKEENLEKLEDLFKIRKKVKRELTDEQREVLRARLSEMRKKKSLLQENA